MKRDSMSPSPAPNRAADRARRTGGAWSWLPGKASPRRGYLAVLVVTALVAALTSGCGSSSSPSATSSGAGNQKPQGTSGAKGLIIQLNGGTASPFYVAVKQGSDDAAKALGLTYQYVAPKDFKNFVPDMATLIRASIARRPAALIIGDYAPSAFDPLIKQAVSQGIPVLLANAGLPQWKSLGAIGFVGEDPVTGGEAAGTASAQAGIRHLLCVNEATENPAIIQRCNGAKSKVAAAGGTMDTLNIPLSSQSNPAALQQDIEGFLRSHASVDGVYVAAGSPASAVAAVKAVGKEGKIKVGSADIWANQLQQIKSGQVLFAINQQPYIQGWYSLQIIDQYLRYKLRPTEAVNTGGLAITKSNVDAFLAVDKENPNVLGPAG
jgi:simple sugar transport system substrate-binding protein